MEIADLIVITKADGPLLTVAKQARIEVKAALHLMRPRQSVWKPRVL